MKHIFKALTAGLLLISISACSLQDKVDREIQLPIYETTQKINKTAVSVMDLEENNKVPASIGYATADALTVAVKGNLITNNVASYKSFKEGEVIAAFDSSELDYEYLNQSIYTEAALQAYQQQGTEAARVEYEYQKALLDEVEYRRECYVIYAPYDCIITDAAHLTVGKEMNKGDYICSVAPADDIFVYIDYDPEKDKSTPFKLGTKVTVTLTGKAHEATVVSMPDNKCYNHPLKYSSYLTAGQSAEGLSLFSEEYPESSPYNMGFSYSRNDLGLASGNYKVQNTAFERANEKSTAVDSSRNIIIGFEPEVLAELLEETPNAVRAGWATVSVVTKKYCNVLALPRNAVTVKDASYVYLYEDGQRIQTPVITGDTINGYTVILEGLCEGDEVAY